MLRNRQLLCWVDHPRERWLTWHPHVGLREMSLNVSKLECWLSINLQAKIQKGYVIYIQHHEETQIKYHQGQSRRPTLGFGTSTCRQQPSNLTMFQWLICNKIIYLIDKFFPSIIVDYFGIFFMATVFCIVPSSSVDHHMAATSNNSIFIVVTSGFL